MFYSGNSVNTPHTKRAFSAIIGVLLFTGLLGSHTLLTTEKTTISAIQTNITQQQKMQPSQWPKLETIYLNQIKEASGDIIILPETILPTVIHKRPLA